MKKILKVTCIMVSFILYFNLFNNYKINNEAYAEEANYPQQPENMASTPEKEDISIPWEKINESKEVSEEEKDTISVPTIKSNVRVTNGNQSVELSWDDVEGAEGYIIKRSITSGSEYAVIADDVTETTYTDTEVTNEITYYYVVVVKDKSGESKILEEVIATPKKSVTVPAVLINGPVTEENKNVGESDNPSKVSDIPLSESSAIPTGLTVKNSDKSVNLTWSDANGALTYKVKRATTSGGPYTLVADNITDTTYTDTGLTNGISYYYVVSAVNSQGESANSTEITALPDIAKPNSPTGINVSTAHRRITLAWSKTDNADSYIVKKATTSGGPYTTVSNNLTKTTYEESGLTNGTSYYYIIIAKNEKGESEPSIEIEAVPGIQTPKNVILKVVDKEVKLSWDPVANADIYKIKRSENIDGPYTILNQGVSGTSYSDKTVIQNKRYYYVIYAVNSLGESPETEPISAIVKDSEKRYILLIMFNNGMQKEYDIDTSISINFINWYTNRANGIGSPIFTLFNQEKEDVFNNSKDYIGFNTILYYQLNEYKVNAEK